MVRQLNKSIAVLTWVLSKGMCNKNIIQEKWKISWTEQTDKSWYGSKIFLNFDFYEIKDGKHLVKTTRREFSNKDNYLKTPYDTWNISKL